MCACLSECLCEYGVILRGSANASVNKSVNASVNTITHMGVCLCECVDVLRHSNSISVISWPII